jgi:hypothetical protein
MAVPYIESVCPAAGVTSGGSVSWNHSSSTPTSDQLTLVWVCCGSSSYTSGTRTITITGVGNMYSVGVYQGSSMAIELFAATGGISTTSFSASFSGIGLFVRSVCHSVIIRGYLGLGGSLQQTNGTSGTLASQSYQSKSGALVLNCIASNGNAMSSYSQTLDAQRSVSSSNAPQVFLGHASGGPSPVTFSANKTSGKSWVSLSADLWGKTGNFFPMWDI